MGKHKKRILEDKAKIVKEFKKGNINTKKYKRVLIDTFSYKIYLYDKKMVINYTTKESNDIKLPDLNFVEGTIAPPLTNLFELFELLDRNQSEMIDFFIRKNRKIDLIIKMSKERNNIKKAIPNTYLLL